MLYQYDSEEYDKPIVFTDKSGVCRTKEYQVTKEYNTKFNLLISVNEYENGEIVTLVFGNPTNRNKYRLKSIVSNVELDMKTDDCVINFKVPENE
ncbi:hypothetical protein [Clostridium tyrobutyricum]|uniref:hypothetical protein n=1 Tax=Clostridium tyrobutyricum TaxID=1519 RepID=UPI0010AA111D|nr:hypothetical protein [Clostridium tyrobutyricum]QCH27350.1 hypothetical protein EZN00_00945 [Clostridium tyrobutyricum]